MNGVIYARFSDGPKQTYKSIEGQIRDCMSYADQKGIKIVNTYIDEHISGKDFEGRASFQKLMKDAQKRMFDCVIVWKIDRLGRNREELAISKAKLKRSGVHVHYAMEHIPDGPEGIILESLMEGLAEYYSADLAQKVARGMRESILSGKMINGNQCFGYLVVDRHYVPDPERAYLVQEIFERYVSGETAAKICRDFSLRGIKTTAGEDLKPKAVYKILRNIKYTGLYVYGEISIPDFHERLISDDLFESAQLRLKSVNADFEKAESLDKDNAYILYCHGTFLAHRQDYDKAIQYFTRAITLDDRLAEAYFNRGMVYYYKGDRIKGNADLSKAGELGLYSAYSIIKSNSKK